MKLPYYPTQLLFTATLLLNFFSINAQKEAFTVKKMLIDGQLQEIYENNNQQPNITLAAASLLVCYPNG